MKKKKKKLSISLSVLIIGFLISTSSLNVLSTKALLEEKQNQYKMNSFDGITWKWNITEVVSTESIADSHIPSLALDSASNLHIVWCDVTNYAGSGTDIDIFYKRCDASTALWTTTEVVSTESTADSWNPSLAVDFAGNLHVAWYDYTDYAGSGTDIDIFYKCWNASSSSWTTTKVVSTESTGVSYAPSLAVDNLGDVHISWHDTTDYTGAGTDADIFYKLWDASISNWTITEVISTESTGKSYHPSLAADNIGNVHITWNDQTNYAGAGTDWDIFYKHWNASTSLWTTTEVVSTESTDLSDFPSLAVDNLGNTHIAWSDETNYASSGIYPDIFYKRWDASNSSWTITEVISTERTGANKSYTPSLALDSASNVHIVWRDDTNYAGCGPYWDIFYKRWDASSSSWTITEVVSTESTIDSYNPSLAVDSADNLHIAWYDHTNYAGSGSDWDIFYKLFAGPSVAPATAPKLAFIVPNPTELNTIYLDWNNILRATTYSVYRSTSCICSVEGFSPIITVSSSEYMDTVPSEGLYFYVVVAENFAGNSSPSNCQYVYFEPLALTPTEETSIGIKVIGIMIVFGFVSLIFKKKKII
ncbi:MAG: hypothetical protein GPJ51_07515 [Candidatus Heimdallarchaeota archaeon]|nr:hypothetical protein [Candidatus Heimdallarchaeota archaeon]